MRRLSRLVSAIGFVSLIYIGQIGAADASYGIIGDMGKWNADSKSIQESMLRQKVKRLIMPGDNLYVLKQGYAEVWNPWIEKGFLFSITAIGNHTLGYPMEIAFFKMPGEFFSTVDKELNARFIVLNSDNTKNVNEQMQFLAKEMSATKEKYNFIMYHHPSITISKVHNWEEKKEFQTKLRELVSQNANKVSALIWGHDHFAALYHLNGVPAILSGSGQNPRGGAGEELPQSQGVTFSREWYEKSIEPYWIWLDQPKGNADLRMRVIRAKNDHVVCTFHIGASKAMRLEKDCKDFHESQ